MIPRGNAGLEHSRRGFASEGGSSGTVRIDYRWTGTDPNRIRTFVTEIVRLDPDVILVSSDLVLAPLQQQTGSIPIVFTNITDPVGSGIVASLSRPGGHITGFTLAEFSTYGKLLEFVKRPRPTSRAWLSCSIQNSARRPACYVPLRLWRRRFR